MREKLRLLLPLLITSSGLIVSRFIYFFGCSSEFGVNFRFQGTLSSHLEKMLDASFSITVAIYSYKSYLLAEQMTS